MHPAASLIGYFSSPTGLGIGVRRQFEALERVGCPVEKFNIPLPHRAELSFEGNSGRYLTTRTAIIHINPSALLENAFEVRRMRASIYIIGYWAWELPVFPPLWAAALDLVDEIWVPSSFVAGIFDEITKKPVRVIPHAVPLNAVSSAAARERLGLPEDRYIFLSAFDTESHPMRKNPAAVVRAFLDAFPEQTDSTPLMVLKVQGPRNRDSDLTALLARVAGHPSFRLIDRSLNKDEMADLQAAADCFVSLHRGEGFGLNIAECMAAGRLVIATDFSGNRDFTRSDNSLLVPYAMRAVERGDFLEGTAGQWWAEPDHDRAVDSMRWAVANPEASARLAARARETMADEYSFLRVGGLALRALTVERRWARKLVTFAPTAEVAPNLPPEFRDYVGTGRNSFCPCGSGKKYKHCHADFVARLARPGSAVR